MMYNSLAGYHNNAQRKQNLKGKEDIKREPGKFWTSGAEVRITSMTQLLIWKWIKRMELLQNKEGHLSKKPEGHHKAIWGDSVK